jgi:hypothetical protein
MQKICKNKNKNNQNKNNGERKSIRVLMQKKYAKIKIITTKTQK